MRRLESPTSPLSAEVGVQLASAAVLDECEDGDIGKYDALAAHLAAIPRDQEFVTLTFSQLDEIVGGLPASAYNIRQWWANDSKVEAAAWRSAGWHVDAKGVDLNLQVVRFGRGNVGGGATLWGRHELQNRIVKILADVPVNNPDGHDSGRPYMSALQLAIEIERRFPASYQAVADELAEVGKEQASAVGQYIARQLSVQIRDQGDGHPIEGAFLSNVDITDFRCRRDNGDETGSPLDGHVFDLSIFRLRPSP